MRTLLVHQGEKPLIGILEDGQLAEVFFPQEGDTAEAVLLGRVERIVPECTRRSFVLDWIKTAFCRWKRRTRGCPTRKRATR